MAFWLTLAGVLLGLYALHRLALWAEQRGWIFYMKKKPSTTALGSAFLEIQQLAQPEKRHLLEIKKDQKAEEDEAGGSGDPER